MMNLKITRRDFVKGSAAMAAGIAVGIRPTHTVFAGNPTNEKTNGILNYNEQMEYRRGGRTDVMFSAVCLGGHWKRVEEVLKKPTGADIKGWMDMAELPDFHRNRYDVVTQCIERGINYIDACTGREVTAYAKALKGRREKMYLGFSTIEGRSVHKEWEAAKDSGKPKPPGWTTDRLKEHLDNGFKNAGLDYVDIWRITCMSMSNLHPDDQFAEILEALAWAKKTGRARFIGISSHDRPHIKKWLDKGVEELEVIVTPYTAKTKLTGAKIDVAEEGDTRGVIKVEDAAWEDSLWYAMQKHDVAWFGIKPFASNSLFKGTSAPGDPHAEADDKIARLTIRAILTNPVITAPIPGLITTEQVDNVARAVLQRRELDLKEQAELEAAAERAFANLPDHYQWLKDWEYV